MIGRTERTAWLHRQLTFQKLGQDLKLDYPLRDVLLSLGEPLDNT